MRVILVWKTLVQREWTLRAPRSRMLAQRLLGGARTRMGLSSRQFASCPLAGAQSEYQKLVEKSVKEFQANQATVGADLDAELAKNKVVLFMEGSPDAPKSELGMNVVKMLTQTQVVPLLAVDALAHPAVLGYTVAKSQRQRLPHLYVNGNFYADHDGLLAKYTSGDLKTLGTEATKSSGKAFGGELPIATY